MTERSAGHSLRAGAAIADITPAKLAGLNPMGPGPDFGGVHDPLHVRALVLDNGTSRAALVSLDLLEVGLTNDLRQRIKDELDIPDDHVLLAPTHTHSAPRVGSTPPGGLSRAASPESLAYTEQVFDAVLDTVRRAQAVLRPARLGVGEGSADVNVNRDQLVDGRWVLGPNPDGPSDKAVRVLHVQGVDGSPIALVMNYAVHPTVTLGTGLVSADLAGSAARYVEERLPGAVAVWTAGTIGDQAPRISFESTGGREGRSTADQAFRAAEAQGVIVGAEAVRVAEEMEDLVEELDIHAAEDVRYYPIKRGTSLPADMTQDDIPEVGVRLTALRLGDVLLMGVGGEVTTPIGRALFRRTPLRTMVVSIANERIGYLADDHAFACGTFASRGTPIQPGYVESGIVEGTLELLRRIS